MVGTDPFKAFPFNEHVRLPIGLWLTAASSVIRFLSEVLEGWFGTLQGAEQKNSWQIAGQPFGTCLPSPGLACPAGPWLGGSPEWPLAWGGAGFVRVDAWRCMDRNDKIGKRRVDQPFEANSPVNLNFVICPMIFYLLDLKEML